MFWTVSGLHTEPIVTLDPRIIAAYNAECSGPGVSSLTLASGSSGTATSEGASSTGSNSGSSGLNLGAASRVGLSMMGVVGAGVVSGVATILL